MLVIVVSQAPVQIHHTHMRLQPCCVQPPTVASHCPSHRPHRLPQPQTECSSPTSQGTQLPSPCCAAVYCTGHHRSALRSTTGEGQRQLSPAPVLLRSACVPSPQPRSTRWGGSGMDTAGRRRSVDRLENTSDNPSAGKASPSASPHSCRKPLVPASLPLSTLSVTSDLPSSVHPPPASCSVNPSQSGPDASSRGGVDSSGCCCSTSFPSLPCCC